MSSKMIVLCLLIAAASALPAHSGYAYQEGYTQTVQHHQPTVSHVATHVQPHVSTVSQTTTNYVQPQVSTVTTGTTYHQPSVASVNYGQSAGHGSVGHGSVSHGSVGYGSVGHGSVSHGSVGHGSVSHNVVSHGHGHGSISHGHGSVVSSGHGHASDFSGFPDSPAAVNVGSDYVRTSSGNSFVEEHHGEFGAPLITKSFYTFTGPEDHDEKSAVHHITIGKPQKHFRVIFIKNPSSSVNKALIKAHLAPTEEKTVVYVLSKNENELDIQTEIDNPAPVQPSKPEVVFVKYRHPEEIAHLQQTVQSQYNAIPGENQIAGEEHAPVRSVIGSLGGEGGSTYHGHSGSIGGGFSGSSGSYSTGNLGSASQLVVSQEGTIGAGSGSSYTGSAGSGSGSSYTGGQGSASQIVQSVGSAGSGSGSSYTGSSNTYSTGSQGSSYTSGNVGSASQVVETVGSAGVGSGNSYTTETETYSSESSTH